MNDSVDFLFGSCSQTIINAIVIVGFAFGIFRVWRASRAPQKANIALLQAFPGYMSILGVLGTFIGIYLGLKDFDPSEDQMQRSIPELLNGLKTAFSSSILGLLFNVVLSIWVKDLILKKGNEMPVNVSEEQKLLQQILEVNQQQADNNRSALEQGLKETLQGFNETMKDLLEGIVDENFSALKESIDQLNTWQSTHRKEIHYLNTKLRELIEAFSGIPPAIDQATAHSKNQLTQIGRSLEQSSIQLAIIHTAIGEMVTEEGPFSIVLKQINALLREESPLYSALQASAAALETTLSRYETASYTQINGLESAIKLTHEEMEALLSSTRSFEASQAKISNWLDREEGIHTAMIAYTTGLESFQNKLASIKQTDLESMEASFQQQLSYALRNTFANLDTLIQEYLQFNETLIRGLEEDQKLEIQVQLQEKGEAAIEEPSVNNDAKGTDNEIPDSIEIDTDELPF